MPVHACRQSGSSKEQAKVALQLKHRVTPSGMGESFHVLLMGKGVERQGLSGLRFAGGEEEGGAERPAA